MEADVQASDALLLGHTTYDIFRGFWPGQPDAIGQTFDRIPKYVASRGTPELSWTGSTQLTDAGQEVRELRERHEQIHTWGSVSGGVMSLRYRCLEGLPQTGSNPQA